MPRRPARAWGSVDRGKRRRAIELRNHLIPGAETVACERRQHGRSRHSRAAVRLAESENLACVDTFRTRTERPRKGACMGIRETSDAGTTGKVNSHSTVVRYAKESDGNIIPEKSANKGTAFLAESIEGRTPTESNTDRNAANRVQNRVFASPGLARVRQRAEAEKR